MMEGALLSVPTHALNQAETDGFGWRVTSGSTLNILWAEIVDQGVQTAVCAGHAHGNSL